jgi:MarR family 2-MHQ and catechol resistance regulon transcriptional repressor
VPTHYEGTQEEVRALDAWLKLVRATDSLGARLLGRAAFGDLTPRQFGVLESLYHMGPMRPGEISAKLLKSGGNITLVVDNLEKSGLVRRQRDSDDRRVVVVSLTEKGRERIGSIFPGHVADIVEEMSILTAEEQETLGRLCRKLGKQEKE